MFGEDDSRIRTCPSPENFTLLRRMAISLLNQETSFQRSLKQKAKRAAMDNGYMLKFLSAASLQWHIVRHFFLRLPCLTRRNWYEQMLDYEAVITMLQHF